MTHEEKRARALIAERRYRAKHEEERRIESREYMRKLRITDPERAKKALRKWRASHLEQARERNRNCYRKWYDKNPEEAKRTRMESQRRLRNNNVGYRIGGCLRSRLTTAIKAQLAGKRISAVENLGCSMKDFMLYIESKWTQGMNWGNHGRYGWHIDHIIPLSRFDLTDKKQQEKAVHFSNLQPLWAKDNLRKGPGRML